MFQHPYILEELARERMRTLDALARDALRRSLPPRGPSLTERLAVRALLLIRSRWAARSLPSRVPQGC